MMGVGACSFTPGTLPSDALDTSSFDADITTGWSTPMKILELEHPLGCDDPSMTDDLLQIFFGSSRSGGMGQEDIWFAKRGSVNESFGPPEPATELNTMLNETTMKISGNGKVIYFASNRGGTGHDIYFSTRAELDLPWNTPTLVPELSTSNGDWAPFVQSDQLRVVLCSGATVAGEALFVATRPTTGTPWSPLMRIEELDEPARSECDPNEPRSNVLYYSTDFRNDDGTFDIYRASRSSSTTTYSNRESITSVNLPGVNDRDPWVSPDERTMVFASDRDLVNTQIYMTTRR